MKKTLGLLTVLLAILLFTVSAFGQGNKKDVVYTTGAPTGTCSERWAIDRVTGKGYSCVSGVWTLMAAGSGISGLTNNVLTKGVTGGTSVQDSSITESAGAVTVASESFGLTGAISGAGLFGTSGIRYKNVASTLTDTTSSGTVATNYTNVFGANTLAASSATTITNDFNTYFKDPIAGSNVTLTNKWAFGADSMKIGTSNQLTVSNAGVLSATSPVFVTPTLGAASGTSLASSSGINIGANSATAVVSKALEVYNSDDGAGNYERGFVRWSGNIFQVGDEKLGSGSTRLVSVESNNIIRLNMDATTGGVIQFADRGSVLWSINNGGNLVTGTDGSPSIGLSNSLRPASLFLAGPAITIASGTGITLNDSGSVRDQVYKITLTQAAFSAAATTADATIATLPAKTQLNGIWADVTQVFSGGAVSAATLTCGKTAGGSEYLVSFDIKTATIQRGLADTDLGTSINRANAVQGGDMPSWSATTAIQCRLTTVTANTNALTQGSITFYLRTTKLP